MKFNFEAESKIFDDEENTKEKTIKPIVFLVVDGASMSEFMSVLQQQKIIDRVMTDSRRLRMMWVVENIIH